ncbi:MAG TPA: CPBP family glutamic-type intramembrane protease [Anaerolineales bacterium]|nr:CPBP family glutamic-type intramembrane protease [Anaerolineales bacterium]
MRNRYKQLALLLIGILAVFVGRAALAGVIWMPRTFEIVDTLTVVGSMILVAQDPARLRRSDWLVAPALGAVVGGGMSTASLFSPYPFLGLVEGHGAQAVLRGVFSAIALLGGLAVQRRMGPVRLVGADGEGRAMGRAIGIGFLVGLPLAVVNVIALGVTQGRPIVWQSPVAALLDALQPAIVEEAVYRFALWGLLWLSLKRSLPITAIAWAGGLATAIHAFAHVDDLMRQAPLIALGLGTALAVVWGALPAWLARRSGLESAIAFHWVQDAARFLAGY